MQRIKLTTEWVEWHEVDAGRYRLYGFHDYVAAIKEERGQFTLFMCETAYYNRVVDGWGYADEVSTPLYYRSLDEAKEACLHILIEQGLFNPLDLLMDTACESS